MKKFFVILKNLFVYILIFLVVIALGLFGLEMLVRKIKPQITYTEAVKKATGDFRYSSFAPFSLKPNVVRDKFFINSLGYRSDEFTVEKPKDVYRILVLGDSFVSSVEEDNANAWPKVMQGMLNKGNKKVEVINAGFHDGYSPDSYYAYLKTEGLNLKPDLIVLGLYLQNDVGDLGTNQWDKLDENGLPLKVSSDWRMIDSAGRQFDGFQPLRYRYSYLKESHLWILLANWLDVKYPKLFHPPDEAERYKFYMDWFGLTYSSCIFKEDCFPKFAKEFDKLLMLLNGTSKLLEAQNIPFLIVFEPSRFQLNTMGETLTKDQTYSLQKKITGYFERNKLKAQFLDLTSDFLALNSMDYYLSWDTHWNTNGNYRAALVISGKVSEMMPK